MLDEPTRLALQGATAQLVRGAINRRLRFASLHWRTEPVHSEAWDHLAVAIAAEIDSARTSATPQPRQDAWEVIEAVVRPHVDRPGADPSPGIAEAIVRTLTLHGYCIAVAEPGPVDVCHGGDTPHAFQPGRDMDQPGRVDPDWCDVCGEARPQPEPEPEPEIRRIGFRMPLNDGEVITQEAAQGLIGQSCLVEGQRGTVIAAEVVDDGRALFLTVEGPGMLAAAQDTLLASLRPQETDPLRVAARDVVTAAGRMLDDWAEMGTEDRNRLWSRLHESADRLRDALDETA